MEQKRNLLIFLIPLFVFLCSTVIFTVYVELDWKGQRFEQTGVFCEVINGSLLIEPVNTISNVGFSIVGLVIAWQMMCRTYSANNNILTQSDTMTIVFASLIVFVGPCSAAMHAFYTSWGTKLDVISMYIVCAFVVSYSIQRLFRLRIQFFFCMLPLFILMYKVAWEIDINIPIFEETTNLFFACFIALSILFEICIIFIRKPAIEKLWGVACLLTLSTAFAIWNFSKTDGYLCIPTSIFQGHAAWHLLDALALYFLFLYYVSEHNSPEYTQFIDEELGKQ